MRDNSSDAPTGWARLDPNNLNCSGADVTHSDPLGAAVIHGSDLFDINSDAPVVVSDNEVYFATAGISGSASTPAVVGKVPLSAAAALASARQDQTWLSARPPPRIPAGGGGDS